MKKLLCYSVPSPLTYCFTISTTPKIFCCASIATIEQPRSRHSSLRTMMRGRAKWCSCFRIVAIESPERSLPAFESYRYGNDCRRPTRVVVILKPDQFLHGVSTASMLSDWRAGCSCPGLAIKERHCLFVHRKQPSRLHGHPSIGFMIVTLSSQQLEE